MDAIALPLFNADAKTPVVEAIDLLRTRQRAGLILEKLDVYRLLYLRHLFEARRSKIKLLHEISGGYPVHLLGRDDAGRFDLDLVRPTRTRFQYEQMFLANQPMRGTDYALVGATTDTAIVVTRSEGLTAMLANSGGFQCNGQPENHFFPDPDVIVGQDCPKYPECALPSGRIPIISAV